MPNMWQQFQIEKSKQGHLKISKGFIKSGIHKKPEIMTKEQFQVNEGVQLQDFLFTKFVEIEKDYIGDEQLELPAGTLVAKHYRKVTGNQTVDYWISSEVLPIGLVKLISKSSKNSTNNYQIELNSMLRNVKPAIDPKKAIPMSNETSKLMSRAAIK